MRHIEPADQYGDGGGSSDDWGWTIREDKDAYVISKDGTVLCFRTSRGVIVPIALTGLHSGTRTIQRNLRANAPG